ncbi:MAG: S41 family peptidase [Bryobacteraceae bacterium]|nr:S41 family peptidase [Bryobacteraceae bacterium]MDW8376978.1 S41 family peptidase [Bryobacterales bacterium]
MNNLAVRLNLLALLASFPLIAQLTLEQRIQDFQALASVYARYYAPHDWKVQGVKFNLFDLAPWLEQVRAAQTDLDYLEVCARYVASLKDGHAAWRSGILFSADLGILTDIYDGRVLIDSINRARYPAQQYPFQIGDELLSIDGKPVDLILDELSALRSMGNPVTTRRYAAQVLTQRSATFYPRTVLLGDTAVVEIRRASGEIASYTLTWQKNGIPRRDISPVPPTKAPVASATQIDFAGFLRQFHNRRAADDDPLLRRVYHPETGEWELVHKVLGWGARSPAFSFPAQLAFQQRRGSGSDFFYSGTFQTEGLRIGFLRIPSFPSTNTAAILRELDTELAFFQQNTDGLVVDLMRNTGGGCLALDIARRLMPQRFTFGGEHLLANRENINRFWLLRNLALESRAEPWIITSYEFYLNMLLEAERDHRSLTGAIPTCGAPTNLFDPATGPGGESLAYSKPVIFLADEFSVSFADYFLAAMQDNGRGPVVGARTAGWGGSVAVTSYGPYSEASVSYTITLDSREKPIVSPDLPPAAFIENIGVLPDIPLPFMTRANLLEAGRPFAQQMARIAAEHIRSSR